MRLIHKTGLMKRKHFRGLDIVKWASGAPQNYILLLMILVRNQIRNMLGGVTGKITFGRIKYNFGLGAKEFCFVYSTNRLLKRVRTINRLVPRHGSEFFVECELPSPTEPSAGTD